MSHRSAGPRPGATLVALALITLAALFPLVGCGEEPPPPAEPLRPVRWEPVSAVDGGRVRVFAGVTRAGQEISLSFKVSGTLERLAVRVGDRVQAGDAIATLDDRDLRLQVEEAEASRRRAAAQLRNARAEYERAEALYEADNASLADLEAARAAFETAEAGVQAATNSLELARRRLGYARLTAPVAGAIASVPVEENENVSPGTEVALLTAGDRPEVEVFLPGQLVGELQVGDAATVTINTLPGRRFPARVTEIGVAATGGGNTFPVTVRLERADPDVLSGLAAEVALTFGDDQDAPRFLVPAAAIGADQDGRYAMVIRNLQDGVGLAARVPVTCGDLTSLGLEVLSGLRDGDRLITAGVHRLTDGQRVLVPQQ
jgi:RND family efflux transporter MFP subunit